MLIIYIIFNLKQFNLSLTGKTFRRNLASIRVMLTLEICTQEFFLLSR